MTIITKYSKLFFEKKKKNPRTQLKQILKFIRWTDEQRRRKLQLEPNTSWLRFTPCDPPKTLMLQNTVQKSPIRSCTYRNNPQIPQRIAKSKKSTQAHIQQQASSRSDHPIELCRECRRPERERENEERTGCRPWPPLEMENREWRWWWWWERRGTQNGRETRNLYTDTKVRLSILNFDSGIPDRWG